MRLLTKQFVQQKTSAEREHAMRVDFELTEEIHRLTHELNETKAIVAQEKERIFKEHNEFVSEVMEEQRGIAKENRVLERKRRALMKPIEKLQQEALKKAEEANKRQIKMNEVESRFEAERWKIKQDQDREYAFVYKRQRAVGRKEKEADQALKDAQKTEAEAKSRLKSAKEVETRIGTAYQREIDRNKKFVKELGDKHKELSREVKVLEKRKAEAKKPSMDELSVLMRETQSRDAQCRKDYIKLDSTRRAIMAEYDLFKRKHVCINCNFRYEE